MTGAIITAAFWNTGGRDNLIDLDRRTSPIQAIVGTAESTTSTAWTDLATVGPAVTQIIGSTGKAIVGILAAYSNASSNFALMGYAVSGATVVSANDTISLQTATPSDVRNGIVVVQGSLNAGSNTFTAKYRVTAGTGNYNGRLIWVSPLGA